MKYVPDIGIGLDTSDGLVRLNATLDQYGLI